MMPDDIAVLIYKEVFRSSLNLINKPKTLREYGFVYQRRLITTPSVWDYYIDKVINYLNENVIQEQRVVYEDDGFVNEIWMDYYLIGKNGEKIVISEDQYDEDYDKYYKYMKNSLIFHDELTSDIIMLALNLNPEDGVIDLCLKFHIKAKIGRSNMTLRLMTFDVPDDLPIETQAWLMARQPKREEGRLWIDNK